MRRERLGSAMAPAMGMGMAMAVALGALSCGSSGGPSAPPTTDGACDLTKSPSESPACIDDAVGYFVSARGSTRLEGTKAEPFVDIQQALVRLRTERRARIYVCEGTYYATTTIDLGVEIIGGLDCDWTPSNLETRFIGNTGAPPFTVENSDRAVYFTDLTLASTPSAASTSSARSSVGIVAVGSTLTLRRVKLEAGRGGDAVPVSSTRAPVSGDDGVAGTNAIGGAASECTCGDGMTSRGGRGASAGEGGAPAESGASMPSVGGANQGATGNTCVAGTQGADGAPTTGGRGASMPFVTSTAEWWRLDGGLATATAGAAGLPGQGGGGGGANLDTGSGGGGGACGGCGGAGGMPGLNGGSSIAILSVDSNVTVVNSQLTTSDAGNGAQGASGGGAGVGGRGAAGGSSLGTLPGCSGGGGGSGSGGGGGGGGAGGHSVAIVFAGAAPSVIESAVTPGRAGTGAPGGAGGAAGNDGPRGEAGADGVAAPTLQL